MVFFIDIKVVPSSRHSECILNKQGTITCYLKNSPDKGKANKELIALLAQKINVAQQEISIVLGATQRKKRIKINLILEYKQFLEKLGLEKQKIIF